MIMITRGVFARFEAKPEREAEVESFLRLILPAVRDETKTLAWFALHLGGSRYGIIDFFADEPGLTSHLNGPVAAALRMNADEFFVRPPQIDKFDVLAHKLPVQPIPEPVRKALLLTLKANEDHIHKVERFLREAQAFVAKEAKTIAWFAIRFERGGYGIFDVFPDNGGRLAHLTGHVPRELAKHALTLLGGVPEIDMADIVAEHSGVPMHV